MSAQRSIARAGLALLFVSLAGCEFESAKDAMPTEMNTCISSAACERGSACRDSLCVADASDPLKIALQITPLQTPDGAAPLPVSIDPFLVKAPIEQQFDLPDTTRVRGQVRDDGAPIDASVTFTPTHVLSGIAARPITASVTQSSVTTATMDFIVQLLSGVEYRMDVEPIDMRLPPYSQTFVAGDMGRVDVHFDELPKRTQTLSISGEAADRDLLVTAFSQDTGEPISSTASVTKGKADLVFADSTVVPFWIQIRAAQSFDDEPAMNAMQCDTDTPSFPSFAISDHDIAMEDPSNWRIELPKLPERIRYEGTVDLCPEEQGNAATIKALPVTLRSQSVLLDGETKVRASFAATTNATYDEDTKSLRFCVQVMQGEYNVVATPPAGVRCALFAEQIKIKPPEDEDAALGKLLALPASAYLTGKVQTSSAMPLSSASVEAHALGRDMAVELPNDDPSVTRYNRSSETLTDSTGSFKLPVDLGSYDVVIKPLAESGFPWQVRTNVGVGLGARKAPIGTTIDMASPVVVTGSLRYPRAGEAAQATLGGAEIEAFVLIPTGDGDEERAVAVGKAMADADGRFMLLLPLSIDNAW